MTSASPSGSVSGAAATGDAFISMRHVDKFFGNFQALADMSLDIHLGQKIVICGPSGSGKSTAIRCINRLESHDAGQIAIDGVTIDDSAAARNVLRNNVGMVFQQFNLFPHLSILDNLTLGPIRARGMAPAAAREEKAAAPEPTPRASRGSVQPSCWRKRQASPDGILSRSGAPRRGALRL